MVFPQFESTVPLVRPAYSKEYTAFVANAAPGTKGDTPTREGVSLELYHWAPAHTSGDLVVYLPAEKIGFTGDIIAAQMPDPLIHLEKNGSSEGWIATAKGIVALDCDQYVPGHGDLQSKAMVQARLANAAAKRAKIQELVKQGKSLDEVRAAVDPPPATPPAGGGGRGGGFASYTQVVYTELTKQ